MRILKLITCISFTFLLLGVSCEDEHRSGPEIAWTGGIITFTYHSGFLVGFKANVKFEVTDNQSGEIEVTASHAGENISCVSFVEPGIEYKVIVFCAFSNDFESGSIEIDSPNAEEPYTVANEDNKFGLQSISIE